MREPVTVTSSRLVDWSDDEVASCAYACGASAKDAVSRHSIPAVPVTRDAAPRISEALRAERSIAATACRVETISNSLLTWVCSQTRSGEKPTVQLFAVWKKGGPVRAQM